MSSRWSAYFGAIVLILVSGLVLAGSWATYHAPGRNDQYQLIQLGQSVYHGGRMYVDCWENKPPGIAWINALGFLVARGNPIGPWILPGVVEAGVLVILWAALRRIVMERTARKAVLVAALVYSLRIYDTPSINPDFYSSIFELAAIALLIRGVIPPLKTFYPPQEGRLDSIRRLDVESPAHNEAPEEDLAGSDDSCTYSYLLCALAGLLWAAATSIKQVGCVGLFALTLCGILAAIGKPQMRAHALKATAATWTGFVIGLAAVAGVLWRQGTLTDAWHAIFSFNTGLLNTRDFLGAVANRARVRSELAPLVLPLWLGLTGVIMSFWYRRFRGFPLSMTIGLVLWWVAALVLAAMGPSHSMRYWQATFPPMLILAAVGLYYIQQVQDRLGHPERLTAFVVAATVAVMLARPAVLELRAGLAGSFAASTDHPTEREQLTEIGNRVRTLAGADESVYVLDYRPGIYVYADRLPAAPFIYPRSPQQLGEIVQRLKSAKASLIVVPEKPASEFERLKDDDYRTFVGGILADCQLVEKVQDYMIFRCRD